MPVAQVKKWLAEPVESTLLQVPRALAASILAALCNLGTVILLVETLGFHPVPASVIGYLTGGIVQYVLCSAWVFSQAPSSHAVGFLTFTALSLVGLGLTVAVMAVHDTVHIPYQLANIAAMGLTFVWNFSSRKFLLFRPVPGAATPSPLRVFRAFRGSELPLVESSPPPSIS